MMNTPGTKEKNGAQGKKCKFWWYRNIQMSKENKKNRNIRSCSSKSRLISLVRRRQQANLFMVSINPASAEN